MSTVTEIADAVRDVLAGLDWVTYASDVDFLPPVNQADVCALVLPFDQNSTATADSLGDTITLIHLLNVEFWVQHRSGEAARTLRIGRDAGTLAIAALLAQDGEGYTIAREYQFTERIEPQFVTHLNVPWLVASLRVPVGNEVTT